MNAVGDSARLRGKVDEALHEVSQELTKFDQLVMQAHRDGFNEACDLLGAPASDTPMDRIALAKGKDCVSGSPL